MNRDQAKESREYLEDQADKLGVLDITNILLNDGKFCTW